MNKNNWRDSYQPPGRSREPAVIKIPNAGLDAYHIAIKNHLGVDVVGVGEPSLSRHTASSKTENDLSFEALMLKYNSVPEDLLRPKSELHTARNRPKCPPRGISEDLRLTFKLRKKQRQAEKLNLNRAIYDAAALQASNQPK